MKKYDMDEEAVRRVAIKNLNKVSERIRDKKQSMLRLNHQMQKFECDLLELNQSLEQNLSVIHGIILPKTQSVSTINKEVKS